MIVVSAADYYTTLEIPKDADQAEVKRAYRKMSLIYHPDKNPGTRSLLNTCR